MDSWEVAVTVQVAFLRGINLGNRNRVPMAGLRALMIELGFTDVRTHLQSGNVIFNADAWNESAGWISAAVADRFAVATDVVTRTGDELVEVVERNPLSAEPDDPAKFLVGFLGAAPDPDGVRALEQQSFDADRFWVLGREIYLWCPNGVRGSQLMKAPWERRLGVTATTRNWKTLTKLASMVGG